MGPDHSLGGTGWAREGLDGPGWAREGLDGPGWAREGLDKPGWAREGMEGPLRTSTTKITYKQTNILVTEK